MQVHQVVHFRIDYDFIIGVAQWWNFRLDNELVNADVR